MSNPPPTSIPEKADLESDQRKETASDQPPPSERMPGRDRSADHFGAQRDQPAAQSDDAHGGNASQGYGTQMSGGTQSGQQSGSYSSDSGRGDRRGAQVDGEPEARSAAQDGYGGLEANRSDQDFSQKPGFGGYGPDGGGYGSQSNYASHNTYRSAGDPDVTQRHGAGTTSSHTGTGTRTEGGATGASAGATFGGATTALTKDALGPDSENQGADPASRKQDALAGKSVSSGSTPKSPPE